MSVSFFDPGEAERFILQAFHSDPRRLRHILVIADRVRQSARDINELQTADRVDETLTHCAGLVHDIGYAESAVNTGFHPLDGYHFLCRHQAERLANRIVRHSSAPEEAALLGFELPPGSNDLISRLITYWDVQVAQGGEIVVYEERLADILLRYGEESIVGRANIAARPRIAGIIEQVDCLLHKTAQ